MPDHPNALETQPEADESVGELLRTRALASSPRLLAGQAIAGVALNVAVLLWHPERWGIATAAMATVALHALWSLAVQRTSEPAPATEGEQEEHTLGRHTERPTERSTECSTERPTPTGWWQLRRASAIAAATSALLMLWFVCMMLLGRLTS